MMKYFIFLAILIMFAFFSWFGLKNSKTPTNTSENSTSIYMFIKTNIDKNGELSESGQTLPDENKLLEASGSGFKWAPGALDGAFSHHGTTGNEKELAQKVADYLEKISKSGNKQDQMDLYNILAASSAIDYIDDVITLSGEKRVVIEPYLHSFARSLATDSQDRNPVKFGIALLGIVGDQQDIDYIKLLGKHEEFTLYSAVGIVNIKKDSEGDLWEMAQSVHSWGRIQLVERLRNTQNPEIRNWILREGYKNSVMYEYLAYIAATTGDLDIALSQGNITPDILDSAGEILQALIMGGPAESIEDYEKAPKTINLYLIKIQPSNRVKDFVVVSDILDYLNSDRTKNWTVKDLEEAKSNASLFLAKKGWLKTAEQDLKSEDTITYWNAKRAAKILKMDLWSTYWSRLNRDPSDQGNWYDVMSLANEDNIDKIIMFAETTIPLTEISTGSAKEVGMGVSYKWHNCLDFILQELGKFPGKGIQLVETGIKSPVIRNRNMALRVLSGWRKDSWTKDIQLLLETAYKNEVDEKVKETIKKVIDTGSID